MGVQISLQDSGFTSFDCIPKNGFFIICANPGVRNYRTITCVIYNFVSSIILWKPGPLWVSWGLWGEQVEWAAQDPQDLTTDQVLFDFFIRMIFHLQKRFDCFTKKGKKHVSDQWFSKGWDSNQQQRDLDIYWKGKLWGTNPEPLSHKLWWGCPRWADSDVH